MGHRELEGRSFAPTEPYAVTRDRVAEFAASTGAAYAGGAAPVTFPVVVASAAVRALVDDPGAGLTLARIVHGRQRFSYHRPLWPGDLLSVRLTVESVRSMGGSDYIRTRSDIRDENGELVVTAWATLIQRGATTIPAPAEPAPQEAAGSVAATPRSGEPR
jgi:acyl dehydratase